MKYNYLGGSGLRVSELCLGTMTFGGKGIFKEFGFTQVDEAKEIIGTALDAGINIIDTADLYSSGLSEEIIGKALGPGRKDVLLLTKVRYNTHGNGPNDTGLTRHHIMENVEKSLKNLKTDYIDIYMMHAPDFLTPIEESLRVFDDLVKQGKVRYIAVSNFPGWLLMKAMAVSERFGLQRFIAYQGQYNLASREMENEIMPACKDQEIGIMSWSPLAGGFFTGKYRKGKKIPGGARRSDPESPLMNIFPVDYDKGFKIIDELEKIGKRYDKTIPQVAINYLLRKPGMTTAVIGARNKSQLEENLGSVGWEINEKEVQALDGLSVPVCPYPYWYNELNKGDR